MNTYTVKEVKELLRGDVWRHQHSLSPSKNHITKRVDVILRGRARRVYYVDDDGVGGYSELPSTYIVYVVNRVQV